MQAILIILASAFGMAALLILFAAVVEAVVEYLFGIPADYIPWLTKNKGWMTPIVAIMASMAGAFKYQFDIIYIGGQFLEGVLLQITGEYIALNIAKGFLGILLTGFLLCRGSNWLHDFIKKHLNISTVLKNWAVFGEPEPKE